MRLAFSLLREYEEHWLSNGIPFFSTTLTFLVVKRITCFSFCLLFLFLSILILNKALLVVVDKNRLTVSEI